jgi:hypothetical protein
LERSRFAADPAGAADLGPPLSSVFSVSLWLALRPQRHRELHHSPAITYARRNFS